MNLIASVGADKYKAWSYLCRRAEETAHVDGNIWLPAEFLIGCQEIFFSKSLDAKLVYQFHMCWSNMVWSLLLWKCVGSLQVSSVAHKLAPTGFWVGFAFKMCKAQRWHSPEMLFWFNRYSTKFKYTCVWFRSLFKHANSEADWKIFNNLSNLEQILPSAKHYQSLNDFEANVLNRLAECYCNENHDISCRQQNIHNYILSYIPQSNPWHLTLNIFSILQPLPVLWQKSKILHSVMSTSYN